MKLMSKSHFTGNAIQYSNVIFGNLTSFDGKKMVGRKENARGRHMSKKLDVKPFSLVVVIGRHKDAMVRKAVLAN